MANKRGKKDWGNACKHTPLQEKTKSKKKTQTEKNMNFKLGFGLTVSFLVLVTVALVIVAVLYAKKPNVQPIAGAEKRKTERNPYLKSHASTLFDVPEREVRTSSGDATLVGPNLALVSNFHNNEHKLTISTMKALGKTVFVIDGEPNNLADASNADLVITTKRDPAMLPAISRVSNMYLPCYASYFNEGGMDPRALLAPSSGAPNPEFAVFCYSNCDDKFSGVVARRDFLRLMQRRTGNAVANLGRCYTNEPHAKSELSKTESHFDNCTQFRQFRFVIAFENVQIPGYISEKLVNPLLAGAVPIYLGAPDVAEHFNPKRFINVSNFASFDECIEEVLRLENDPEAYAQMRREPILEGGVLKPENFPLQLGGKFYNELYHHVPASVRVRPSMITANDVRFITFADGVCYRLNRIMHEAQASGYFDTCTGFGPADLPPALLERFGDFIKANPRGYGYWLWKPVIMQMTLRAANWDDLIIYCDSGSSVLPGFDRWMLRYYRTLLYSGDHDVLVFQIRHKASHWTKGDLYRTVGLEMDDEMQLTTCCIMVRKTPSSVELIDKWADLMHANTHNIDDSPSESPNHAFFVEHRHDQSCWDLLVRGKKYPRVFISSDNISDRKDLNVPLCPSRKKI